MKKWRQGGTYLSSICGEVRLETKISKDVNEVNVYVSKNEVITHASVGSVFLVVSLFSLFFHISGLMDIKRIHFQRRIKECWEE